MELTGKNIIGSTVFASGEETFYAKNPATQVPLPKAFHVATREEIHTAVHLAKNAFQRYRLKSGVEKAVFLETIADEIVALGDVLIKRCVDESGLPEARITNERGRTVGQLRLFASLLRAGSWVDARIDLADPERKPLPKPDTRSMLRPIGPVAVFGASNFPLAFSVAGGDTVSALASGCTVVFKGHPSHPGTSELVGHAIHRAVEKLGMPEGTFSLLQGNTVATGAELIRQPDITAVGFTGSFRGGKAIFDEVAKRPVPIPVFAEMGSSNPVFILPHALFTRREQIAKDLAAAVNLGVGQFCTNPGLVFYEKNHSQLFVNALIENFNTYPAGVMLNESIRGNYEGGINRLTLYPEIRVLARGKEEGEGYLGVPHLLQSTGDAFLEDPTLEEEIFGPSTLLIATEDAGQLEKIASSLTGHLTVTVHGTEEDLIQGEALLKILEQKAGRVIINGYPTGVEVAYSMVHGGPFPATTDSRSTSVGTAAILRFVRPVCYQNFPQVLLPPELQDANPLNIWRTVNGEMNRKSIH